jgi:pimeloyl-ACP methyl ester carboxylesterase
LSRGRSRSLLGMLLCVLVASVAACSSEEVSSVASAPASDITWLPCGDIECGQIQIPVDHSAASSEKFTLGLYRRTSSVSNDARTLILVPDKKWSASARDMVEQAALTYGPRINSFNVVAVAPRGSAESVLPTGAEHNVGTLDIVDDLDMVRRALGQEKVSVIGWGTGATAVTAWVMQRPRDFYSAVVDSPLDPSVSPVKQIRQNIAAGELGVLTAVKWCASHLSCTINANVATGLNLLKTDMRLGRVPTDVTNEVIARAAEHALADGNPGVLFDAIAQVMVGSSARLQTLAGAVLVQADALSECANVSQAQAISIVQAYESMSDQYFRLGNTAQLYGFCSAIPAAVRPLGVVKPSAIASEAKVLVTIARGDQMNAPVNAREMAKRLGWKYQSVFANRHLVVGIDRAITQTVMDFLSGER